MDAELLMKMMGDACADIDHGALSTGIWRDAYQMLSGVIREWVGRSDHTRQYNFDRALTKAEVGEMTRRIDNTWRRVPHAEQTGYARGSRVYYRWAAIKTSCDELFWLTTKNPF